MWQRNLLLIGLILLVSSVSALSITNSTTSSQILWHWDACGNPSLIQNISIDGYPVCGFNMSQQDFLLTGLTPASSHTIVINCSGEDYSNTATTNGTPVTPGGYTSSFLGSEIVHVNQSSVQDTTGGKAEPWILWVLAGYIGLILLVLALIKPRSYHMDYEINIILSVLAWPFLWYFTWGALTSIDYIVGSAMADVNGASVMITQHILYSFPILGVIGVAGDVVAVFITILLISQFRLFKEMENKQRNQRSEDI